MKLGNLVKNLKGEEWIRPRYVEYIRHRDYMQEAEHAKNIIGRPERDRSKGWSASSAGRCIREQLYQARGAKKKKPDDKSMAIFQEGHYVHLKHQTAGLTAGYLSEVEVSVEIPHLNVLGTMDGVTSEMDVAEYKSINPYQYGTVNQFGPKAEHLRQVHAYMRAFDTKIARILYENKGTQEMREFRVEFRNEIDERNLEDWEDLNHHMENDTRPPMLPSCRLEEGPFKWCPYAEVCREDSKQEERPLLTLRRSSSGGSSRK